MGQLLKEFRRPNRNWRNSNKSVFGENLSFGLVDRRVGSERRCSTQIRESSSCSSRWSAVASSLQRALRPAVHILHKVFDSSITLLASYVTAVDNSSSYEPTRLSFFLIFVHFAVVN